MNCPNCNNKLISDALVKCPFCGSDIPHKTEKSTSTISRFTPGKKREVLPTRKDDDNCRGAVPELFKEENSSVRPVLKKYGQVSLHDDGKDLPDNSDVSLNDGKSLESTDVSGKSENDKTDDINNKPETKEQPQTGNDSQNSNQELETGKDTVKKTSEMSGIKPNHTIDDKKMDDERNAPDSSDDITMDENVEPKKTNKFKRLFGKKKKEHPKKAEAEKEDIPVDDMTDDDLSDDETDPYDTNLDGYYDDLIPDLARQINKIPQDNIIKAVFLIIFVIIMIGIILATS